MKIEYWQVIMSFFDLKPGDAFTFVSQGQCHFPADSSIFIKCEEIKSRTAVNLKTGKIHIINCNRVVMPVLAKVVWRLMASGG